MKSKFNLFQKHFLVAMTTVILFIVLGFFFSDFLMRTLNEKSAPERLPPVFMAKILDRMNPDDKEKGLRELKSWHNIDRSPTIILINNQGEVLYPPDYEIEFDWSQTRKPEVAYDYTGIKNSKTEGDLIRLNSKTPEFIYMPKKMPPPPGSPRMLGLGGRPQPPNDGLKGTRLQPPPMDRGQKYFPLVGLISLLVSLLLGVAAAISLIYYSINKKVKLADQVISELQKGNLKARFPIIRKDDFGQAMMRFNMMADEIEKLVEHLKTAELARTTLLQDLAHDLRTPIASLKNLLETLQTKREKLDAATHGELTSLSLREVDYFERLVEDLLLVAQVSEPKYQKNQESFSLNDMIEEEGENHLFKYSTGTKKIEFTVDNSAQMEMINGDKHLLQRLFRNAFDNAFSFAKSSVHIEIQKSDAQHISVVIEDDGPGFSQAALKDYGERKLSRKIEKDQNGRLSVGLGSVVMKTIAQAHRGHVVVSNRISDEGLILGARTEIILAV